MRQITRHAVNPVNDTLKIEVQDDPGSGGANHRYVVTGFDTRRNPAGDQSLLGGASIVFQNGPIAERGVNGITHEVLLAIVEDRLKAFQAGVYACPENERALLHVEAALGALHSRTKERMARNVEGTHQK